MVLETSVFEDIVNFISNTAKVVGFNWIAIIAFSLLLLTIVISFVCTMFSIDSKTSKAVQKINLYLENNPYVNEDNLVEFNKLMKSIPAPMRAQWQQYMIGRNKKPSEYFTDENCIDKPFKASSYASHVMAVKVLVVCISVFAFIFCAGALGDLRLAQVLLQASLISAMIATLGALYILFLKSRRNSMLYSLYYNFTNLKNYLDRAVTTLPDYVDYEILFTKKEIAGGIPVLQEYLRQRAEYEQQQIEHAKASQVDHEQYDFSQLGVDASIIMEKAMRECEYMIGNKKRILSEIMELQSNLESYERTYDEKFKGTQRKLRDIQESLDRLKEKLQTTTNMIVGNDLRKQRENEIEKQRQIEKESAEDTRKFEASKKEIMEQIAGKRAEIEEFRKNAEAVLTDEFKAYSTKIYEKLKQIADEQVKDELDNAHQNIQSLQEELENKEKVLVEKTAILNEQMDIEDYAKELQDSYEELRVAYEGVQKDLNQKEEELEEMQLKMQELQYEKQVEYEKQAENKELKDELDYNEVELPKEEQTEKAEEKSEQKTEEKVDDGLVVRNLLDDELLDEKAVNVEEKTEEPKEEINTKQLEDTQQILETIVQNNEKPVKKQKPSQKKKKTVEKKPKNKKTKMVEEKPKVAVIEEQPKKKPNNNGNNDSGGAMNIGLSLDQFNEQLKNIISEVANKDGEGKK